jgi:hypothetical protein
MFFLFEFFCFVLKFFVVPAAAHVVKLFDKFFLYCGTLLWR